MMARCLPERVVPFRLLNIEIPLTYLPRDVLAPSSSTFMQSSTGPSTFHCHFQNLLRERTGGRSTLPIDGHLFCRLASFKVMPAVTASSTTLPLHR